MIHSGHLRYKEEMQLLLTQAFCSVQQTLVTLHPHISGRADGCRFTIEAADIRNKQSETTETGWSSGFEVGGGALILPNTIIIIIRCYIEGCTRMWKDLTWNFKSKA